MIHRAGKRPAGASLLRSGMLPRQVLTSRDAARSVDAAMAVSRWSTTRSGSIPSDSAWNVVMIR